ncbi:SurA N-terminal domain-containing protein [Neoehrlichia mikurensis]|uniref:SurA N-terminal domain-containing protein n=1 Tax=Neoehrlichia mikurensis TaxID=89586 RepID=A0A9Q9F3U3_9RICK|nr:peptidylprolyl isomerase [Neoehrlichia mikurensis]QXK92026.1 SurA N-terminal domain-containing protein [Neoehrlichia mikurensis]QXK92484.1 SurA N-terminal domain-containing protein [Neoehrlichia mikurensis]QXK93719.1 SurA N-terminal domain-containing protein [Neoehrlichia mikurensis]UTO55308.1 SurA N-terminal domain-containing protein [Neoehrlichia mikurensis]UTO56228.1 SurA N-terminal domain-containing protein [Neoehrlichia mikurensis]
MKLKGVFIKLLLIVLLCSLVFITFGNYFLSNYKNEKYVATVGSSKISLQEFQTAYNNELTYIQQLINHQLSDEQINQFHIKSSVLHKLIEEKVLQKLSHDLNLKIGKESILEYIKGIKYFHDSNGKFSKEKFQQTLSSAGISETSYISSLHNSFPIAILMNCLFSDAANVYLQYNDNILKKIFKDLHQSRIVDIIEISLKAIKNVPIPDDKDLRNIYDKSSKDLSFPEYRAAKYIAISEEDFIHKVTASSEEISNDIKNNELDNQVDIFNLVFLTQKEAESAYQLLKEGKSFNSVVSDVAKTTLQDITLKNITKNMLPDNIRGIVFKLKEEEISGVLHSVFGWHIIKIKSIHKISDDNLKELSAQVSLNIRRQKASDLLAKFVKEINNQIHQGISLEKLAELHKLNINSIASFDINGNDANGNLVNMPSFLDKKDDFTVVAFSSQLNKPSSFVSSGNGYFSINVTEVTPPRNKTFEESKNILISKWQNTFKINAMYTLSKDLAEKFKSGNNVETDGVSLKKDQKVSKIDVASTDNPGQDYPYGLVNDIFNINIGDSTTGFMNANNSKLYIAILKKINTPQEIKELDLIQFKTQVNNNNIDSLKDQLLKYLMKKYSVQVNQELVNKVR